MSIKRNLRIIGLVAVIAFMVPFQSSAAINTPSDSTADSRMAAHIIQRVNEIQNMDKTNLTAVEKKELKKELREMKKNASGLNSKVYLSVGAIIIIILVLILIL